MNAKPPETPPHVLNVERPSEPSDLHSGPSIFNQDEVAWLKGRFSLTDHEAEALNPAGQEKTNDENDDLHNIGEEDIRRRLKDEIHPRLGALNCANAVTIVLQDLGQEYDLDWPDALSPAWTPPSSAFAEHRRPQRELGLTVIESDIIALAARGFSNREIAQALAIKPRQSRDPVTAVKDHLGRIRTKQKAHGLEMGGRLQIVANTYRISDRVPAEARELFGLQERQSQVLELVVRDFENQQIADALGIGLPTVKGHIKALFRRTGARNRTHLMAITCGLVHPPSIEIETDET